MKEKLKKISKEQVSLLLKCLLLGLLPLLVSWITCVSQGYSIRQVSLPVSEWNDELFYFKQVEAILSHGYPQGYFGFNESHALKYSFAAWSPVLVWPWLLYGVIFGWNLLSPIICNIALLCITMVLVVLLVRPTWKQCGIFSLLFVTFTPFSRYMLCGMPEIICFCMVMAYFALLYSELEKHKRGKLILLFIMAVVMTWMRPYLILFLLLPAYLWFRKNKMVAICGSVCIFGVTGVVYYLINHYLGAEYFTPLFKTEWIDPFLQGHILTGIRGILVRIYYEGKNFFAITKQGFISGLAEGSFFICFLVIMLILFGQAFLDFMESRRNKDEQKGKLALLNGYLALCFFAMWMALLLMYKMKEGSKHLLTFMVMGILAISLMKTKFFKKAVVLAATFVLLFWVKGDQPYDYQVPFETVERNAQMEYWEKVFDEKLTLSSENVPNYDNVVIWTFADENVLTDWQVLYALPSGFGISCCYSDYVMDHLGDLQSKYLLIPSGGKMQKACEDAGMELVGDDGRACMYHTRNAYARLKEIYGKEKEAFLQGEYEALYLSMDPTEYVNDEIFSVYRGVNTYVLKNPMDNEGKIHWVMEDWFQESLGISTIYLEYNPLLSMETDPNEMIEKLRANHPGVVIEVILASPSVNTWRACENRDEALKKYEDVAQAFLYAENTFVFFPGNQSWLIANEDNYEKGTQPLSCIYNPSVTRNLWISMVCDRRFLLDSVDSFSADGMNALVQSTGSSLDASFADVKGNEKAKQWIFIGDSVIGNYTDSTSVPEVISSFGECEAVNCGYGGLSMAQGEENGAWAMDVIYGITREDGSRLPEVPAKSGVVKVANSENPVIFISFGINDYISGKPMENSDNPYDQKTYMGALRCVIEELKGSDLNAEIVLCTPTYIDTFSQGTEDMSGYALELADYVNGVKMVGAEYDLQVLDLYSELPFSENPEVYLADGVHPSEMGRYLMALKILELMK